MNQATTDRTTNRVGDEPGANLAHRLSKTCAPGARFALAAITLGACGDDPTSPTKIEDAEFAPSLGVNLANMTKTASGLYYEDLELGSGDVATGGLEARVAYAGWLVDGTQFDAGEFGFVLGSGQVVPGFDEGVRGMRPGGVRLVVLPPELGYGSRGSGPIPPNSILVFRIELLELDLGTEA